MDVTNNRITSILKRLETELGTSLKNYLSQPITPEYIENIKANVVKILAKKTSDREANNINLIVMPEIMGESITIIPGNIFTAALLNNDYIPYPVCDYHENKSSVQWLYSNDARYDFRKGVQNADGSWEKYPVCHVENYKEV